MKQKAIVAAALTAVSALGLVAAHASAGQRSSPGVTVVAAPSYIAVRGSLGAVHNSANVKEFIGCELRAYGDQNNNPPNPTEGNCQANDGTTSYRCNINTNDMGLFKAIGTLNGSSHLEFRMNNGLCTEIYVDNTSKYVAKNAGLKTGDDGSDSEVTVASAGSTGAGALGSARTSGDSIQYIGCQLSISGNNNTKTAYCYARAADGTFTSCSSQRQHVINVISAVKPDSRISFEGGECGSRVEVLNSSRWRPTH